MNTMERIYMTFARLVPENHVKKIGEMLSYAGLKMDPEVWTGFALSYSMGIGLVLTLLLGIMLKVPVLAEAIFFLIFSATAYGVFFFLLDFAVEQRTKQIEEHLPDALQLIAANLTAGMTPDKALFLSARPEFGVLSDEIKRMGEEAITGEPVEDTLEKFASRVRSKRVKRVIGLLTEGMKSGGELSGLLNQTAHDLRMGEVIEEEIRSNVGMYVVFVIMAVLIAAPVLFAVSVNFVSITTGIRTEIGAGQISQGLAITAPAGLKGTAPTLLQAPAVDIGFLKLFAYLILTIAAVFGAILLGVLREGEEKAGLADVPVFVFVTLLVYTIAEAGISNVLKSFFA